MQRTREDNSVHHSSRLVRGPQGMVSRSSVTPLDLKKASMSLPRPSNFFFIQPSRDQMLSTHLFAASFDDDRPPFICKYTSWSQSANLPSSFSTSPLSSFTRFSFFRRAGLSSLS